MQTLLLSESPVLIPIHLHRPSPYCRCFALLLSNITIVESVAHLIRMLRLLALIYEMQIGMKKKSVNLTFWGCEQSKVFMLTVAAAQIRSSKINLVSSLLSSSTPSETIFILNLWTLSDTDSSDFTGLSDFTMWPWRPHMQKNNMWSTLICKIKKTEAACQLSWRFPIIFCRVLWLCCSLVGGMFGQDLAPVAPCTSSRNKTLDCSSYRQLAYAPCAMSCWWSNKKNLFFTPEMPLLS